MTSPTPPALQRKGTGPVSAAISPNHAQHQACSFMTRDHPIKPCREKRLAYNARRHATVRSAHRPTQS
jgi:hypothetical protein